MGLTENKKSFIDLLSEKLGSTAYNSRYDPTNPNIQVLPNLPIALCNQYYNNYYGCSAVSFSCVPASLSATYSFTREFYDCEMQRKRTDCYEISEPDLQRLQNLSTFSIDGEISDILVNFIKKRFLVSSSYSWSNTWEFDEFRETIKSKNQESSNGK